MNPFDHERFDVYRAAIEFIGVANETVEQLPRGRSYLVDQLNRAATSIVLNIARARARARTTSRKPRTRLQGHTDSDDPPLCPARGEMVPSTGATVAEGRVL